MAVYTGTGDSGNTSLLGGVRKPKSEIVFNVLGSLDEFNATLGLLVSEVSFTNESKDFIVQIQRDLFKVGSLIANAKADNLSFNWLYSRTQVLESYIDEMEVELPELKNFILPGGSKGSAYTHLSRTICRRLERELVAYFSEELPGKEFVLRYTNRLSDFLFTLARYLNFKDNIGDIIWKDSNE